MFQILLDGCLHYTAETRAEAEELADAVQVNYPESVVEIVEPFEILE